jgi:replicative DNA helicase
MASMIDAHLEEVLRRMDRPYIGLSTGFPSFDEASGGLQPEHMLILGGPPKSFKSSILLKAAISVAEQDKHSLVVGIEMSNSEQNDRALGMVGGVDGDAIMRGHFTDEQRRKLDRAADTLRKLQITMVHDVGSTLASIHAQVRKYRPDAIFIDGAYLLNDTVRANDNETVRMTGISRGLKRLAAGEGLPLFATTQQLVGKLNKRRETTVEGFGWTSAWAQDANVVMGIDRPDLTRPEGLLKVLAGRHMLGMEIPVIVDYGRGLCEESGKVYQPEVKYEGRYRDDDD